MGVVRHPQMAHWGYDSIENTRPRLLVFVPRSGILKVAMSASPI